MLDSIICTDVLGVKRDEKGGREGQLTRTRERKRGSSMTSKQNRGGPASPSHPPWLHRNTRAYAYPADTLLSSLLCHASLPSAQPGTERHCTTFSTLQPCARSHPHSQAPFRQRQGICCPSGTGSHTLYMHGAEITLGGLHWYHNKQ